VNRCAENSTEIKAAHSETRKAASLGPFAEAPQIREPAIPLVGDPAGETPTINPGAPLDTSASPLFRSDTLAQSLIALAVLAVVQRAVGFGRSVIVCGWLEPDQLGQWDLANRFFVLAAPLVVLGLPGSFGRYLEHYRQRGVLQSVLLRTTFVCALLAVIAVAVMLLAPRYVAALIFGETESASNVGLLAAGLVAVIAYNYLTEMLTALRLVRVSSLVQFLNSIAFAALSIVLLALWRQDGMAIVAAYGGACLLLVLIAGARLAAGWSRLPRDRAALPQSDMWRKLLPFAAWVWVTNLLYNLFEVVDRYMLLYVGNLPDVKASIGQYHSAQVVPVLLVSIAGLSAGVILPHLSRDWEAGDRMRVSATLNLTLKLLGLAMFAGSVAVLFAAPLLFDYFWQGKYADGAALLPLALASCGWLGLLTVAQMYLWCAERATLGCVALAIGLVLNVVLNLMLIPAYGLGGAVVATTTSNLAVLLIVFCLDRGVGMSFQPATIVIALLPAGLLFGTWVALAVLVAAAFALFGSGHLLTGEERQRIGAVWQEYRSRLQLPGV
jgi:O-antigen/teichoic acid export membrane protein